MLLIQLHPRTSSIRRWFWHLCLVQIGVWRSWEWRWTDCDHHATQDDKQKPGISWSSLCLSCVTCPIFCWIGWGGIVWNQSYGLLSRSCFLNWYVLVQARLMVLNEESLSVTRFTITPFHHFAISVQLLLSCLSTSNIDSTQWFWTQYLCTYREKVDRQFARF